MTAKFILSLDCEGKWGMADQISDYHDHHLTSERLRDAYARLLGLFARYELPVTFAFVMAFLLSPDEQREHDHLFPTCEPGTQWLRHFRAAQDRGDLNGWSSPELLDMVRDAGGNKIGGHEIGCHGFSHLPLGEDASRTSVAAEFAAVRDIAARRGVTLETLVFPRNQVGHVDLVEQAGFVGYRDRLAQGGGRIGALAAEFAGRPKPQAGAKPNPIGSTAIPAGFFFNWRVGARRMVPPSVTEMRWRNMVNAAGANDVVHLWLHPHNIITGPETFGVLERVLRNVARRRDAGVLEAVTQSTYCHQL